MKKLPQKWATYATLQADLLTSRRVSERSWGTEAALNELLCNHEKIDLLNSDSAERIAASRRRRERRRERLRLVYMSRLGEAVHPEDALDARHRLNAIRLKTSPSDWSLLFQLGLGESYESISVTTRTTPGSLRTKVRRLRVILAAKPRHPK